MTVCRLAYGLQNNAVKDKGDKRMIYNITDFSNSYLQKIEQLDFLANNIANVNTNGFKSSKVFFSSLQRQIVVDHSSGALQRTDHPFDIAINGDGYFTVQAGEEIFYTKKGNFTLDKEGYLTTSEGYYVLGKSEKIKLQSGMVQVNETGDILESGNKVDSLKIARFTNPQSLVRLEGCFFKDNGDAGIVEKSDSLIRQGYIELSNVQAAKEMAEMISINRSLEIYQKSIQTVSDIDRLSTSRVGKLI